MKIWKSKKLAQKVQDGIVEVMFEVSAQYAEIRWTKNDKTETIQIEG